MKELSKCDVLNNNMIKFSKIIKFFEFEFLFSFTQKRKYEVIKKYINDIVKNAYILLEIKKDYIKYIKDNECAQVYTSFLCDISETCNQLEKRLVLYNILVKCNE